MKKQLAKILLPILSLGAVIALVTVIGCSNSNSPATSYNDTPNALVAPNYTTSADVVSLENENDFSVLSVAGDDKRSTSDRNPRLIIRCLELNKDQLRKFNEAMSDYEDCIRAAREAYRAAEKSIRERTSAAEREIKAQLKAGTITNEEARAKMKEIGTAARTALQAAKEEYEKAVRGCKDTLFASIEEILVNNPGTGAKQLEIWRNWVKTGKVPCADGKGREPRDSVKR
ncbi:MAG: hypothetical protein HYZ54_00810 [Ignavibacteriae bacterium]|nr:hypothetical protein [Ignavibacteriota bacterium]